MLEWCVALREAKIEFLYHKQELKDQMDKRKRHQEVEDIPAAKRIRHKGKRKL